MFLKFFVLLAILPQLAGSAQSSVKGEDSLFMVDRPSYLYGEALAATARNDYIKARNCFRSLLNTSLPPHIYYEVQLQLSAIDIRFQEFEGARIRLQALMHQKPPSPVIFRVKMLMATIEFEKKNLQASWQILKELEGRYPFLLWPLENRLLYVMVELLRCQKD